MKNVKLDQVDRVILGELQKNGRATNVALAGRAGVSAPPCLRRLKALETSGLIVGYYTDVNAPKLGFNITLFVQVSLKEHSEESMHAFERLVDGWPRVRECYSLTGESDFLLKIVARNWEDYQKFHDELMMSAPNVAHIKSLPTMRRTKFTPGVPLNLDESKS